MSRENTLAYNAMEDELLKRLAELQAAGLAENVVETQLATIAELGSPQTGPNGEPNLTLLAAQASLRLVTS